MRSQGKVVTFVDEFNFIFVDQTFEFIVLESIHQQLLIQSKTFIIEEQNASQSKNNLTFLIVNKGHKFFVVHILFIKRIFPVKFKASFKSSINNLPNKISI